MHNTVIQLAPSHGPNSLFHLSSRSASRPRELRALQEIENRQHRTPEHTVCQNPERGPCPFRTRRISEHTIFKRPSIRRVTLGITIVVRFGCWNVGMRRKLEPSPLFSRASAETMGRHFTLGVNALDAPSHRRGSVLAPVIPTPVT